MPETLEDSLYRPSRQVASPLIILLQTGFGYIPLIAVSPLQLLTMKRAAIKITIFFFLTAISLVAVCQNQMVDSIKQTISQLNRQQVEKDSLIALLAKQAETIKANNDLLTNAISVNGNIFGGLSTYFTLIAILVSIIVIALPLLNYFFVLKPNKESLQRLEKLETELPRKFESDFGHYLEDFEKRKAKELISSLSDPSKLNPVVNFFFLSKFTDFDNDDQQKVVSFLQRHKEIESIDRTVLNSILKSRPSLVSESYYKSVIQDEDKLDYEPAIEYLIDNNPEGNMRFWEIIITASENGHKMLLDIVHHIIDTYVGSPPNKKSPAKRDIGEKLVKLFLNNQKICDAVQSKPLSQLYKMSHDVHINTISWNPFLEDTLYIKTYFVGKRRKKTDD